MKYFLYIVVAIFCITAGATGTAWRLNSNFTSMTGLSWTQFTTANDRCIERSQEQCALYGGFAPLSQFKGQSKQPDTI